MEPAISAKPRSMLGMKLFGPASPFTPGQDNLATPKASAANNINPFDTVQSGGLPRSPTTPTHHPLLKSPFLGPPSPAATVSPAPSEPPTAAFSAFASAIPTTQVSLHVPDFNMASPPKPPNGRLISPASSQPPSPTATTQQHHQNNTVAIAGATATSAAATTGTSQSNTQGRGQIHVKLIQARGLSVRSTTASKPYVVVQFEQNEFVSRDPTDERDKEIKGTAISRTNSSTAVNALGAIESKAAAYAAARSGVKTPVANVSPASSLGSGKSNLIAPPASLFGRLNASNPVWKHEVSFDVTSELSLISFNVYDRSNEDHDFLGTLQVKPVLVHDHTVDQWYKLRPYDSEIVTGDMRIQVTFEQYKTKRALTPKDFEFLKLIGRGTFGKVFQVRKRDTKRIYAMKVLSKKEIVAKKEVAHTIGERKILQTTMQCPFLVGLKFSFQTDTDLYLVTDFKSGGELFWHLQRETRFQEDRARFYVAELILALEHLHKYDIVYRDLKPENILLDATGHVALCDFGLSKPDLRSDELTTTFCGTTEYLAPEILLDEHGYSKIVDFWSLGVLLFEMCCGWSPFYAEETQQMYKNICFGKIRFPKGVICEEGKMFVKGLLNRNPKHRLGALRDAAELKEHPFFASIDWKALSLKQVTPPFKPVVESDDSTDCFDTEFTGADISDFVEMSDEDYGLDEQDPSEDWLSQSFTGSVPHTPNGPLGSERLSRSTSGSSLSARLGASLGFSSYSNGTASTAAPMTNGRGPSTKAKGSGSSGSEGRSAAMEIKSKKKKKDVQRGSPLTNSVQENFRGFSYTGGESVTNGFSAMTALGRQFDDDEEMSAVNGDQMFNGVADDEMYGGRFAESQRHRNQADIMSY
ncbi:Pkinase-domain-containing protein [Flagelloscypha sp. PMI_526]|nr:Pkinase-domain-containing protein [Flagelloscypha sp. PMI_526]